MAEKNSETEKPEILTPDKDRKNNTNRSHDGHFLWGFLLIFIGVTLILINMGVLPGTIWDHLWQYWPFLLIFWGIRILIGNFPLGNFLTALIFLFFLSSIWTKALIDINSPLIVKWGLNNLPWFDLLKNLNIGAK